ncbi:hypothetical protein NEISICOT_03706 [Neisseria sicca ATCC 29256]|uniref:Uncharacterized protein n=1 Tax=Neisseria sicca ATCC 29256 TaxID=547045 RepID=C6MAX4_NEISI|nr:hypothetical protein NEISICOT_03706 [Neisseria sicca ATCC 29256]
MGRISGYLKRKQPKTCVGVSVVGGRAFLQRSPYVLPVHGGRCRLVSFLF